MTLVALTQRSDDHPARDERRDALDQRWTRLLGVCGLVPLLLPNDVAQAGELLDRCAVGGVILTGGNDLARYGGDAPERDRLERHLIERAFVQKTPLLGVCRGMQVIQDYFGVSLERVAGHVTPSLSVAMAGQRREVNSFHQWGARSTVDALKVWACSDDGVVKGVRHRVAPILGIMWHPERCQPIDEEDRKLIVSHFEPKSSPTTAAINEGTVYWITGLSGSGKTTVGRQLWAQLQRAGRRVVFLDGDEMREVFGDSGHTAVDRRRAAERYSRLSRLLASQGVDVVCCTISMFKDCWEWNRVNISRYREIYMSVEMQTLINRDPKQIYRRAFAGELANVWGVDLPFDVPATPDLVVDNDGRRSPEHLATEILAALG